MWTPRPGEYGVLGGAEPKRTFPERCGRSLPRWIRSPSACAGAGDRGNARGARGRRSRRRRRRAGREAERVAYLRSSAKPFQALPLVRARRPDGGGDRDRVRIHLASPEQLAAVRSLLAKAPRPRRSSSAGTSRRRSSTTAPASTRACSPSAAKGWASGGYRLATHPVQRLPRRGRCRRRRPGRRDPDGGRRLRGRHLRAPARADGADVLPARVDRRRRPRRGGDARASGADPGSDGGGLAADARARGLDGEGRRRGCSARPARTASGSRSRSRTGTCAQCAPRSPSCSAGSGSRPASSGSSRSRTRAGTSSARSWWPNEGRAEIGLPDGAVRCRIQPSMVRAGAPAIRLFVCQRGPVPSSREESEVHAHRRYRAS